jgi:AcrR family transcriptional regulator
VQRALHNSINSCNLVEVGANGNGGATRAAILDAADRLLATRGFKKLTMDEIAGEAEVSRRTIYMYFPSKEEVRLCSIDRIVEGIRRRLQELADSGHDPADTLRTMLVERVLLRVERVRAYRTSLDELFEVVRPAYLARRTTYFEREAEVIAAVLEDGRARGRFVIDDAAATAMTLVKATNAFLPYNLSVEELGDPVRIEAEVRRMAELLLRSLVASARPRATPRRSRKSAARDRPLVALARRKS